MIEKIVLALFGVYLIYVAMTLIRKMNSNVNDNYDGDLDITIGRTSQYKGIYYDRTRKKWKSQITIDGKRHNMGSFGTEDEAFYALENFKHNEHFYK